MYCKHKTGAKKNNNNNNIPVGFYLQLIKTHTKNDDSLFLYVDICVPCGGGNRGNKTILLRLAQVLLFIIVIGFQVAVRADSFITVVAVSVVGKTNLKQKMTERSAENEK